MPEEQAPLKLLTIGDSISQGFMSLAAARTDLCYSSIIAREMEWDKTAGSYNIPKWEKGGHPLNLEDLFRKLVSRIGNKLNILNIIEDLRASQVVTQFFDEVEEYYERGAGSYDKDYDPLNSFFHNIAVRGFTVSDAWTLNYDLCDRIIKQATGTYQNDKMSVPSADFFRTAARVLNPNPVVNKQFNNFTAIDWLQYHAKETGVDNVFLWLGANNVLATVLDMQMRPSPGNMEILKHIDPNIEGDERMAMYYEYEKRYNTNKKNELALKHNIWHVDDFRRDYENLLNLTDKALEGSKTEKTTKIFVGNVPYVTILPLARGMGQEFHKDDKRYFEYYTYFPFDDVNLAENPDLPSLRLSEVMFIESTIREYNYIINDLVKAHNIKSGYDRYHVVDFATSLEQMAFRRNNGVPNYNLPDYIANRYPVPDTRYYDRSLKQGVKGGIFSLDGVHPTAIGQGLIAYEFLKVMHKAKLEVKTKEQIIRGKNGEPDRIEKVPDIDWERIYNDDALYNQPLYLVSELFKHDWIKKLLVNLNIFER